MPQSSLMHHLLPLLLHRLEAEGQRFGVDVHLRLHQLLGQLPDDYPPERLQYLLAPLLTKSPAAQQAFYGIFAEVLREARSLHDTPTDPATAASDTPEAQSERRWRRWAMALGALLLLGLLAVWYLGQRVQDEVRADVRQTLALYAGQTSYLQADTLLADANAAEFLDNHRSDTLHTAKVYYRLQDSLRLLLTPLDTAGTDSITLLLRNPQGDSLRWTVVSVLRPPLTETTVADTDMVRALFEPIANLPYPHDVFSLTRTPPSPAGQLLRDYLPWIKAALLLLVTALLLVLLVWRDRRRRKLVAELEQRTRPPYVWDIRFEQAAEIDFGDTLGLLLNQLRQRTAAEARELDVPATVRATVQGGGMVDFRYRQHTRPPEYLLLIDEQHHHNHRARLFNQLYARFLEEEIIISRYFYHGDPRLCFNEEHPRGIPLQDLAAKHPDTRLLLLGSGQALLSPTNGQLVRWGKLLTRWGERALLSPVPLAEWGLRESQLAELLPVLPAGLASLSFLIEQWDAGEEGEPDRWRQALGTAHTPPSIQLAEGGLLATLQAHYEPPLLHWIAACAVYPQLQYELTCQLGQLLSSPDQKLLTAENLNRLNLLPWFVAGQMPRAVRVLLLDYLEREQPALLLRVRQFLHASLQASSPPADSAAAADHRLQMALNEWRFTEDARRKTQLEKDIAQQLRAGAEADFTVVKFLEGQPSLIDLIVPDSLKRYFSYSDYPALDWRDLSRDLLRWALPLWLSLLVATLWYRPVDCTGELVAYQGQTLCIQTCQDQMWLLEQRALDTLHAAGLPSFEALLAELQNPDRCQGAGMDSTLNAEVRLNLATALYNQGVALHTTQRDSACQYFAAIARLLPEGLRTTDFVRAIGWCEGSGTPIAAIATKDGLQTCCAPCTIQLLNQSINYNAFLWTFEDGSTSGTEVEPIRRYAQPGVYTIQLVAKNGQDTSTTQLKITVTDCTTPNTLTLSGTVRSADTPLPNAEVSSGYGAARTDASGRYTLRFVPDAAYRGRVLVKVSAAGHTPLEQEVLTPNADTRANFTLEKEVPPTPPVQTDGQASTTGTTTDPVPAETLPQATTIADIATNMKLVSGDTFTMGCKDGRDTDCDEDEKPDRQVTVPTFFLSRYEVTQAQWRAVMGSYPPELYNKGCDLCPVEGVSWDDIQDFLTRLNAQTGQNYRLPTEAEWEYAARGGNVSRGYQYSGSKNPDEVAWYRSNSREGNTHGAEKTTRPVGGKKANELGLYDMSGNVWEWVQDCWHANYTNAPNNGRAWLEADDGDCGRRVLRGGSWVISTGVCRAAYRGRSPDTPYRNNANGFRLARD